MIISAQFQSGQLESDGYKKYRQFHPDPILSLPNLQVGRTIAEISAASELRNEQVYANMVGKQQTEYKSIQIVA